MELEAGPLSVALSGSNLAASPGPHPPLISDFHGRGTEIFRGRVRI